MAAAGTFDVLVNSAGAARHGPAADTSEADFDAVVALNLRGAYFLTRAVTRGLLEAGRPGSLINVPSQMGHVGGADRAVYCATKHAVEGFTKAMAIEWGAAGIRVNTVCPTFVETAMTASTFVDPERLRWIADKIKLGRVGRVEDVAAAVLYLAADVPPPPGALARLRSHDGAPGRRRDGRRSRRHADRLHRPRDGRAAARRPRRPAGRARLDAPAKPFLTELRPARPLSSAQV